MVNFGPADTVPERFRGRQFYQHNPTVTLMRTTAEECRRIGEEIGRKAAAARGPATIVLPLGGVSAIDAPGKAFEDVAARRALFDGIRATAGETAVKEYDGHINDAAIAERLARELLDLLALHRTHAPPQTA